MRWTADEAIRAARALAPSDLVWLEEPTVPEDVAGHVRVLREGGPRSPPARISTRSPSSSTLIAAGGVRSREPDLSDCGGVTVWLKVAHLAEARNLPATSHGVHDLHVHLLAAVPNASYLEAHGFGLERFIAAHLETPARLEPSRPSRPSHGVELDWKAGSAPLRAD